MTVYFLSIAAVLLASLIFFTSPVDSDSTATKIVYLVLVGIVLIIIAGFRGDFTSDYSGYEHIFNYHDQFRGLRLLLDNKENLETGFVLFNWIIGLFTNNAMWLFLVSSTIIVVLYFREIYKYSSNIFLSVLLFVTIGEYYTSFNIMRQILTAAIIFAGSSYLYERKFWKYLAVVLFAYLFHTTALIMIPFYFILNMRFNYKKLVLSLFALAFFSTNIHNVLAFTQQFFYGHYQAGSYGMTGYGLKNLVLPVGILIFSIYGYSLNLYEEDNKINIWFNGIVFYVFFVFLGLNIEMLERFSYFFLPYVLLVIPKIVTTEQIKHIRLIYYLVIITGAIMYNLVTLSGTGYDPYYFIWNR